MHAFSIAKNRLRGRSLVAFLLSLMLGEAIVSQGCKRAEEGGKPVAKVLDGWNYFRQGDFVAATDAFEGALASSGNKGDAVSAKKQGLQAMYGLAQTWDLGR